jgi:hypothetical protein
MIGQSRPISSSGQVVNPVFGSSELACFGGFSHCCTNWVKINIHRTSQQRCFIKKILTVISALPKSAGTIVLSITTSGDIFRQTSHPPADIRQTSTKLSEPIRVICDHVHLGLTRLRRITILLAPFRIEAQPALRYLVVGPRRYDIGSRAQHDMRMIRQHCVGKAIDPEDAGEKL